MKSFVSVMCMISINIIVFVVMQSIFYMIVVQNQAKMTIVDKIEQIIDAIDDPIILQMIKYQTQDETYKNTDDEKTQRNNERLFKFVWLPMVVSTTLLLITFIAMENRVGLIWSNGLIWMSYLTEIVLFFTLMQPYPIATNYELALGMLKTKDTDPNDAENAEELVKYYKKFAADFKISMSLFNEQSVHVARSD